MLNLLFLVVKLSKLKI